MNGLRHGQYVVFVDMVKYMPIVMQFIVFWNVLDYWLSGNSYSGWVYPLLGHSLIYDCMLLVLSFILRFCLWHKLLIANLIFNIVVEWLLVNFDTGMDVPVVVCWQGIMSLMFIVCAFLANKCSVCPEED